MFALTIAVLLASQPLNPVIPAVAVGSAPPAERTLLPRSSPPISVPLWAQERDRFAPRVGYIDWATTSPTRRPGRVYVQLSRTTDRRFSIVRFRDYGDYCDCSRRGDPEPRRPWVSPYESQAPQTTQPLGIRFRSGLRIGAVVPNIRPTIHPTIHVVPRAGVSQSRPVR